jgi:ABC-2 type transport system ATP-binding protein
VEQPSAAIEARGLTKRFGEITAVDALDLTLSAGRIYGLLGPNGSGKTTLIRLLTGLARPTSGEARVLGVRMPDRENLARIGYMTQADGIYIELSVWENLRFFAALSGSRDRAALDEALELVQLSNRRNTPVLQLSGGMRRRLSLACALVHRPVVLFLDEPTVGLDPTARRLVWERLEALGESGTTILVTTHQMEEAERQCDRIAIMDRGRIAAEGSPGELRARHGVGALEDVFTEVTGGRLEEGGSFRDVRASRKRSRRLA